MPVAAGGAHSDTIAPVVAEDRLRAQLYRLLAALLSTPPGRGTLAVTADLSGDPATALGRAISALARFARETTPQAAQQDYQDLFIGLARGELLPYGSYYLTGFLHEKPLARLRQDMASLGIRRREGTSEPEDHIASLLEMMAGLIDGAFGAPLTTAEQRRFYEAHVGSWAPHFFKDLAGTERSPFYGAVGSVGQAFLEIENETFAMG